jgi:hypothetical protein
MRSSESPSSATQTCPACDGSTRNGACVDCGRQLGAVPQVPETPDTPTVISVGATSPTITFSAPGTPPLAWKSTSPLTPTRGNVTPVIERPEERTRLPSRAWQAILVVLGMVTAAVLASMLSTPPGDPLDSFAPIAAIDTDSSRIDEWAREQFGSDDSRDSISRTARARVALEREMAQSMVGAEGTRTDWHRVAVWANIAQALGLHDLEMLELAADLNVQLAVHASGVSKVEALNRLARARALLGKLLAVEANRVQPGRVSRKLADIDVLELASNHDRGKDR